MRFQPLRDPLPSLPPGRGNRTHPPGSYPQPWLWALAHPARQRLWTLPATATGTEGKLRG